VDVVRFHLLLIFIITIDIISLGKGDTTVQAGTHCQMGHHRVTAAGNCLPNKFPYAETLAGAHLPAIATCTPTGNHILNRLLSCLVNLVLR
jgi:hypothetical protein